jgi:hypothetical protein
MGSTQSRQINAVLSFLEQQVRRKEVKEPKALNYKRGKSYDMISEIR